MSKLLDKDTIVILLMSNINYANKKIAEFNKRFKDNPGSALSYSFNIFEEAARKELAAVVLGSLKNKENVEAIVEYLRNNVIVKARWQYNSTSPTANLWGRCLLQANAELLSKISENK